MSGICGSKNYLPYPPPQMDPQRFDLQLKIKVSSLDSHLLLVSQCFLWLQNPMEIIGLPSNFLEQTLENWPAPQIPQPYHPTHAVACEAPWFYLGFSSTRSVASSVGQSRHVSKYVNLPAEKNRGPGCWIHLGSKRPVIDRLALPKTSSSPQKIGHPKRKRSSSNHPFSGAMIWRGT